MRSHPGGLVLTDHNLTGTANTVRAFALMMAERRQGKKGFRHGAGYSAFKWGIIGFMKSAAIDLGQYQIRVNALVPGLIDTPMTLNPTRLKEAYLDYETNPPANLTKEEVAKVRGAHTAMHLPWLGPDEMAPIVVFLGSDEFVHSSGANVDGGNSAQFTA